MRIAVFGAGAVGGYFGGRLAQAGEEVIFIARGEHLQAMLQKGLRVDSIKGDFVISPVQATSDPRQVGEVDWILVSVKAWQVPEVAPEMLPMIGANTGVVPLVNGVDAPSQLAAVLGAEHVLGGLCRISVFRAAPGHIRHVGIEPTVAFGELNLQLTPRVEQLRRAFERSGVSVSVPSNIHVAMWEKFTFIAAISGMGAITRVPAGALRSVPETRALLIQAIEEIVAVAWKRGVPLPEDAAARTLAVIDGLPAEVIASMQRDIMDGKPSELASQNGAVMRMGLESGVPTPVNAFIYHCLLPQELIARSELPR